MAITIDYDSTPMLSLEHVRGFVAVAEEAHFGRAARRLQMTQPPLSRQIQRLERDVGVRLLDRTQRGVALTPAGLAFLEEARRLLALANAAPDTARRVAAGRAGTVCVGFTATAGFGVLGALVTRIEDALPDVELVLSELVSAVQFDRLRSGALDLALARPPFDTEEFASRLVHREPLVAALPAAHPLAEETGEMPVERLDGEALLLYSADQAGYFADLTARVLATVNHTSTHFLTQVHTMVALVAAGRGVALVPASATRLRFDGVRYRPLAGLPADPVELHAVWRRSAVNPALLNVIELLDA
ncbi:LysR family transcriptional regulator [Marinactinospora rubrisoli]|uniref:LysR family transcriptional regulator n=1 Tax=Marinactinospora rubrisoli TaxID=2715399 RepID=A0ABW2KGS0_9ACTN